MASTLMVSISGIRGVIGSTLTPSVIVGFVSAFGHLQRTRFAANSERLIILGRDSRVSGPWIENIVQGVLASQGFTVLTVGIVPTPTVQVLVQQKNALGGVIVTSSHNPVQWNGLKFVDSDGIFLAPDLCEKLFQLERTPAQISFASWNEGGKIVEYKAALNDHLDAVLSLPYININTIKSKKYKVCLDTINGAGGVIMKQLLDRLGCTVVALNGDQTGIFNHEPEPLPENLGQLCEAIREHKADFGIAVDPDVDRCVFIDETGKPIGEEYTLAIAVKFMLGHVGRRGVVCKNLSSSRAIDDVAKEYGCSVFAAKVGEINVAESMLAQKAIIGGEGNGGVMLPDVHIGRDAPVAAALVVMQLALFGGSMSALKASLPQWEIVKMKTPVQGVDVDSAVAKIIDEWSAKGATIDTRDGVRIDTNDFWVQMRKSNTEPIVRVIGEAKDANRAKEVCEEFMGRIK